MTDIFTLIILGVLFLTLYYEVFLLMTFVEERFLKPRKSSSTEGSLKPLPSVTIIVPCYNEEKTIDATISSLFALEYPKHLFNIIIVDDGSTDGTWKSIKKYEGLPGVSTLKKENGGKHTALNYALKYVKTELVGCLDADSVVAPDALLEIAKSFADPTIKAVTPAIRIKEPSTVIQHIQHAEYSFAVFVRRVLGMLGAIYVTPGPFSIIRRSVFDKIGGYRKAHHTEDLEIALRMQISDFRIANNYKASVYTVGPRTLKTLYKQRLRWTQGFLQNMIDYRHLILNRKYGNLGVFILPLSLTALLTTVLMVGIFFITLFNTSSQKILKIQTVGISWFSYSDIGIDLFYLNTSAAIFLAVVVMLLTGFIIYLGASFGGGRQPIRGYIYFTFVYGLIAPLWLFKAMYNTALSKSISWK
jgi:poly-beta-1,6-N-acetyl-D-glucosamine synthase